MIYYKLVEEDNTFLTQKMIKKKYLLLVEENKMICKLQMDIFQATIAN